MNQVTAKKKVKMIKVIKNTAKKKLPSTKWTGDWVEIAEGWGTLLISSLMEVSMDQLPDLMGVPRVRSPGFLKWPTDIEQGTGDAAVSWL